MNPLSYIEAGTPGAPILFFIHGWPDRAELWQNQLSFFAKTHHCIAVTLPCFGDELEKVDDFPMVVDRLAATIIRCKTPDTPSVTVVGHDWGAYLAYMLDQRHPDVANRLITLDVGGHLEPRGLAHGLFLVSYQWWLAAAYGLGKISAGLGDSMSRWFARLMHAPQADAVKSRCNWPYFYLWRAVIFSGFGFSGFKGALLRDAHPRKPLLYMYGADKRWHFHSEEWLSRVRAASGGVVLAMKGGHWFLLSDVAATNAAISEFLHASP